MWWRLYYDMVEATKQCGRGFIVMWWRLYSDVVEAIQDMVKSIQ